MSRLAVVVVSNYLTGAQIMFFFALMIAVTLAEPMQASNHIYASPPNPANGVGFFAATGYFSKPSAFGTFISYGNYTAVPHPTKTGTFDIHVYETYEFPDSSTLTIEDDEQINLFSSSTPYRDGRCEGRFTGGTGNKANITGNWNIVFSGIFTCQPASVVPVTPQAVPCVPCPFPGAPQGVCFFLEIDDQYIGSLRR